MANLVKIVVQLLCSIFWIMVYVICDKSVKCDSCGAMTYGNNIVISNKGVAHISTLCNVLLIYMLSWEALTINPRQMV